LGYRFNPLHLTRSLNFPEPAFQRKKKTSVWPSRVYIKPNLKEGLKKWRQFLRTALEEERDRMQFEERIMLMVVLCEL